MSSTEMCVGKELANEVEDNSPSLILSVTPAGQPGNPVDLANAPEWHDLFYGRVTPERVKELGRFLRSDPNRFFRLYHGTSADHPILEKGLLPTSARRAKSLQAGHGFVYLSVYPGMAETFGRMAYPGKNIQVYAVEVTARRLAADLDQLRNKRAWGDGSLGEVGSSLAESLVIGHGARVRGKVEAWQIRPIEIIE